MSGLNFSIEWRVSGVWRIEGNTFQESAAAFAAMRRRDRVDSVARRIVTVESGKCIAYGAHAFPQDSSPGGSMRKSCYLVSVTDPTTYATIEAAREAAISVARGGSAAVIWEASKIKSVIMKMKPVYEVTDL